MPQDEQKRQKALLKKRRKQNAAQAQQTKPTSNSALEAIIRHAQSYPLLECYITRGWDKEDLGMVEVMVTRQQPDNHVCFGLYLIDTFCLGVKEYTGQGWCASAHVP
ncbi:MAG TPA: hypothetical protein VGD98_08385 [Ktedonobacteraceae bacterium]